MVEKRAQIPKLLSGPTEQHQTFTKEGSGCQGLWQHHSGVTHKVRAGLTHGSHPPSHLTPEAQGSCGAQGTPKEEEMKTALDAKCGTELLLQDLFTPLAPTEGCREGLC